MSGEAIWRMFERELRKRALAPMTEEEASQHALDAVRAYVKPGADPRVDWAENDSPKDSGLFVEPDDSGYSKVLRERTRKFTRATRRWARHRGGRRSVFEVASDDGGVTWSVEPYDSRGIGNYVPRDVFRWREPAHRAALTERARAHAALVPGNRATMEAAR